MEKETLEEAAERYESTFEEFSQGTESIDFIAGAKWQAERMYSEEEVLKLLLDSEEYTSRFNDRTDLKKWFKFKKK
jgi:hypothetical protein